MATRKRTVEIEVVVDDKQAKKNLGGVDQQVGKTGKAFSDFAKIAAGVLAFDKVVDFARQTITAFSDLNESVNAVEVTFGDAADGILELGKKAAESVGLSNAEFNSLAVGFSAFVEKIAGAEGASVADTMDDLTVRIADFASVMNLEVAEAAEKFRSGLSGETEPLRKFGIDVSAAAVTQEALASGLAGSSAELTEQDKILARYNLIMQQTEKTAGDFANTSEDLANKQRILGAQFTDFQAQLGEELVPIAEEALQAGSNLISAFDEDVNLGWSQRLSAAMQTLMGESTESVQAYIEQKAALNDVGVASEEAAKSASQLTDAEKRVRGELDQVTESTEQVAAETANLEFETERATISANAHRDALINKRKALQNIHDPLSQMVSQTKALEEAEDAVAKAERKYGEDSQEYRDAVLDRANVIGDLEQTLRDLKADGIDPTGAAARTMLQGLGIPDHVIDGIFEQFNALERDFEGRRFNMHIEVPDIRAKPDGSWERVGSRNFFHQGGVVPGTPGEDVPIMAQAGEEVTRRADAGSQSVDLRDLIRQLQPSQNITVHAPDGMNEFSLASAIAWRLRTSGV